MNTSDNSRETYLNSLLDLPSEERSKALAALSQDELVEITDKLAKKAKEKLDFHEYKDGRLTLASLTSNIPYSSSNDIKKDNEYWSIMYHLIKSDNPGRDLKDLKVLEEANMQFEQELKNRQISCDLTAEASLLVEAGQYKEALTKCKKALDYAFTNPWTHYYIIFCVYKVKTVPEVASKKKKEASAELDFLYEMQKIIDGEKIIWNSNISARSLFYQEHYQYSPTLHQIRPNGHMIAETGGVDGRKSYLYNQVKAKEPQAIEEFENKIHHCAAKEKKVPKFGISFFLVWAIMVGFSVFAIFFGKEMLIPEKGVSQMDVLGVVAYWLLFLIIALQMLANYFSLKLTIILSVIGIIISGGAISIGLTEMIPAEYVLLCTKGMLAISVLILLLRIPSSGSKKKYEKAQWEVETYEQTVILPLEKQVLNELGEKIKAKADHPIIREYLGSNVYDYIKQNKL